MGGGGGVGVCCAKKTWNFKRFVLGSEVRMRIVAVWFRYDSV